MFLFDTMIVSYLIRRDPLGKLYSGELEANEPIFVSCQTIGEIYFGAAQRNWGQEKLARVEDFFKYFSVLPINAQTAKIYGDIRAGSDKLGRSLLSQDAWILSTAKQYGLTLVSHDSDMLVGEKLGITVLNRA